MPVPRANPTPELTRLRPSAPLAPRPRRGSVFPAPPRGVLGAATHSEACVLGRRIQGPRGAAADFHLLGKIADVEEQLAEGLSPGGLPGGRRSARGSRDSGTGGVCRCGSRYDARRCIRCGHRRLPLEVSRRSAPSLHGRRLGRSAWNQDRAVAQGKGAAQTGGHTGPPIADGMPVLGRVHPPGEDPRHTLTATSHPAGIGQRHSLLPGGEQDRTVVGAAEGGSALHPDRVDRHARSFGYRRCSRAAPPGAWDGGFGGHFLASGGSAPVRLSQPGRGAAW